VDIGGGIGVVEMELADSGLGSATVVEASPAYFEVARSEVESRYGSRPTQFVVGDFAAMASTLADADVVTLDRVVCCYPDAEDLLRAAAQRARAFVHSPESMHGCWRPPA
jgi:ubiquinone/menaquinone biosynthesis C-methylase UbiE